MENCQSRARQVPAAPSPVLCVCHLWRAAMDLLWVCDTQGTCANVGTLPASQGSPNSIPGHQQSKLLSRSFLISSIFCSFTLHRVKWRAAQDRHRLIKLRCVLFFQQIVRWDVCILLGFFGRKKVHFFPVCTVFIIFSGRTRWVEEKNLRMKLFLTNVPHFLCSVVKPGRHLQIGNWGGGEPRNVCLFWESTAAPGIYISFHESHALTRSHWFDDKEESGCGGALQELLSHTFFGCYCSALSPAFPEQEYNLEGDSMRAACTCWELQDQTRDGEAGAESAAPFLPWAPCFVLVLHWAKAQSSSWLIRRWVSLLVKFDSFLKTSGKAWDMLGPWKQENTQPPPHVHL